MNINQVFPSKYLKESDLQDKEVPVKIDHIAMESINENEDPKPVLYFLGKQKGLVCNKTNAMTISVAYGDETDEWHGKDIILHPDTTMFGGKMVKCIRLRVPRVTATDEDEPPF